jgi:steroid 5-alpha reductase family enzyme
MPRLWFLVNLIGINLMPTMLVFLGMIPVYFGIISPAPASLLTWAGLLVCALAMLLELTADRQMDAYRRRPEPKSPYITEGLWLLCRHPNYLGEVLFWWGIWLMGMGAAPALWTAVGPACITALFVFISIPMMEKHILESRPEYARYIREVPALLPILGRQKRAGSARPI